MLISDDAFQYFMSMHNLEKFKILFLRIIVVLACSAFRTLNVQISHTGKQFQLLLAWYNLLANETKCKEITEHFIQKDNKKKITKISQSRRIINVYNNWNDNNNIGSRCKTRHSKMHSMNFSEQHILYPCYCVITLVYEMIDIAAIALICLPIIVVVFAKRLVWHT